MKIVKKSTGGDDGDPYSSSEKRRNRTKKQDEGEPKRWSFFQNLKRAKKDSRRQNRNKQENLQGDTENMRRMVAGVRKLQEISAKEIMIPRVDVDFLDKSSSTEELQAALSRSSHSRLPVYAETTDKIVGILYAKDLIPYWVEKKEFRVEEICRKPYFVPESMKVDTLLAEFQHRHVHIAMVVDEYGGLSGIVCLEDILEEIVGDIQDEFDQEEEEIVTLDKHVYLCDARLNINSLNEELDLELPADDCDTIGGFVFSLLGKIPSRYERVYHENIEFIVHKLEGNRIEVLKVILHEENKQEEQQSSEEKQEVKKIAD